jgi:hypothetical protein
MQIIHREMVRRSLLNKISKQLSGRTEDDKEKSRIVQ